MIRRGYTAEEIMDLAEWVDGPDVEVCGSGLVLPFGIQGGQVVNASYARKMAAQMLLAADTHDTIFDRGFQEGLKSAEEQCATLRYALQTVRNVMNWRRDGSKHPGPSEFGRAIHMLESLTGNPNDQPKETPNVGI